MSKPPPLPPLPRVGDLSAQQVRGAACVHCGIHLGAGPAVDLGEQTAQVADLKVRWFPRACTGHGGT